MKCKGDSQHDITEGHKFCGECGSPAEEPVIAKAEGELSAEELAQGLDALGVIAKANAGLGDDLIDDLDDLDDPDAIDTEQLLKSELVRPGEDGTIDALPILDLLLKANNRQASIIQALGRELRSLRQDFGVVTKAEETVSRAYIARLDQLANRLNDAIETWSGLPRPRRAQVELVHKAVQTGAGDPQGGQKDASLAGDALIAKAVALENQGLILQDDAGRVAHFANRGITLDGLAQHRADLHARLVAGIAQQSRQSQ